MDSLMKMSALPTIKISKTEIFLSILLLLYCSAGWWIPKLDRTAALLDPGIWQLILLSLICFLTLVGLCWWLLQHYWLKLGLPPIQLMVLQFKKLVLWQQFAFYWASFALLLLAGVMSLVAIF